MPWSDHSGYAERWAAEAALLDAHGVYEKLAGQLAPGNVLEIGCGTGRESLRLTALGSVLALDNNQSLIAEARARLADCPSASFHLCDLFNLTDLDIQKINDFQPKSIVAWFIGGSGTDVLRWTSEQPDPLAKGKLYREKLEDVITSPGILTSAVDVISLVNRSGRIAECSDQEVIQAAIDDYNEHVFARCGFEVVDVTLDDWPREGSKFLYGAAPNPNLAEGSAIPTIISIVAKRKGIAAV